MSKPTIAIQTMASDDRGGKLRSITPDAEGVYRNQPLCVLGEKSRNGIVYDVKSGMHAFSNTNTSFGYNVGDGCQEGEVQHPPRESPVARLTRIDRTQVSHYISAISFDHIGDRTVVYGDITPTGPYGDFLREAMADPGRNASFSLRAACKPMKGKPDNWRSVRAAITFDFVASSGFPTASKRHIKMEDYEVTVEVEDFMDPAVSRNIFVESASNNDILELFDAPQVIIGGRSVGVYDDIFGNLVDPEGRGRRSLMGEFLREVK